MSIYNRPYMRADPAYAPASWSALKWIIISLVAGFLLQVVAQNWLGFPNLPILLGLSPVGLSNGWGWTLLTYGWMHQLQAGLPWHLLGNCLFLYWFGRAVQPRIGSQRFLEAFVCCILLGGITWLLVRFIAPDAFPLIGASAGVSGILTVFFLFHWHDRLGIPFTQLQFAGRHFFYVILGIESLLFVLWELSPNSGSAIAHSAHLGGMAGGYLYHRFLLARPTLADAFRSFGTKVKPISRQEPKRSAATKPGAPKPGKFSVNVGNRKELRAEVDAILDKINREGFSSLTPEEKRTLDRAKDMLN